jgi:hypothetical protein
VSDLLDIGAALRAAAVVVPHTDADGLASGALALRARGEDAEAAVLLGRGEVPWGRDFGGSVALLDWGVRPSAPPRGDRRPPRARGRSGAANAGAERVRRRAGALDGRARALGVPEQPAWVAAVGAVGRPRRRRLRAARNAPGAPKTAVRKLVPARQRARAGCRTARAHRLALLVEHDDPKSALADPRVAELDEARRAWRAGFDVAVRTAPARRRRPWPRSSSPRRSRSIRSSPRPGRGASHRGSCWRPTRDTSPGE